MTTSERLKHLLIYTPNCDNECSLCKYKYTDDKCEEHLSGIMADHLLSKGVVYPRCKVGDMVYCINQKDKRIFHSNIKYITITNKGLSYVTYWDSAYHDEDFGEIIFLSEEEAEEALKNNKNSKAMPKTLSKFNILQGGKVQ